MMFEYEDKIEKELSDFCLLDENPKINLNPVEASSYLNIQLFLPPEGFQEMVDKIFNKYINYLDQFIQVNSTSNQVYLVSTLNRLNGKFQNIRDQFNNSSLRLNWKIQSTSFTLQNANDDFNIGKKQKYTREAYRFFYDMSGTQMFFLDKIISYLDMQTSPFYQNTTKQKKQNNHSTFKLSDHITNNDNLLEYIYDKLTEQKLIDCNKREFKKLFIPVGEGPQPIIWKKDYVHLSYLIKRLSENIIRKQKAPSHYLIATQLFFNKEMDIFFTPKKVRHDKDPIKADKDLIDSIITYAERTYLVSTDTKKLK